MSHKVFYFIVLGVVMVSCGTAQQITSATPKTDWYKVVKIKAMPTVYVIYAKRRDTLYKICSPKWSGVDSGYRVKRGRAYPFKLQSILPKTWNGQSMADANRFVTGMEYHGAMISFDDATNYDLFKADNLKGRYLLK